MAAALDFDPATFGIELEHRETYDAQVARACCEESLLWFTRYFFKVREGITFRVNDHHRIVVQKLEDIFYGRAQNVVFNVPPGSSKTELAVINLMAWAIAKNARCRFLHLSYADTLVKENSSKTKELIESEEYQALWRRTIRKDSKARDRWNVEVAGKRAGGCYAVPLGGTVTGFRAGHMAPGFQGAILIDDPLKPEDAFSPAKLKSANRKLADTVRSRKASPGTPVIIIMQRLHVEDATQFALDGKIGGLVFEQVKVPAFTEDGRSYWEYKEPLVELLAWKKANPYTFAGQMLQDPTVLGGTMFKGDWWKTWTPKTLPQITQIKIYADTALKKGEANDYSVFQVWGLGVDGKIYLLDQIRDRWESPELKFNAIAFWTKWRAHPMGDTFPGPSALAVEDKASGTGLIQSLRRETAIPVQAIPRGNDQNKIVRANSTAPSIQAGLVVIPADAPWVSDYLTEFGQFSPAMTHAHDDQVDPTMDAVHDLILGKLDFYAGAL